MGSPRPRPRFAELLRRSWELRLKLGHAHGHKDEFQNDKERAERKKKSTITASMFDHQVAAKMGPFFDDVFLPAMKKFVQSGLSYDEVKQVVGIPTRWGAKISGRQFAERLCRGDRGKMIMNELQPDPVDPEIPEPSPWSPPAATPELYLPQEWVKPGRPGVRGRRLAGRFSAS